MAFSNSFTFSPNGAIQFSETHPVCIEAHSPRPTYADWQEANVLARLWPPRLYCFDALSLRHSKGLKPFFLVDGQPALSSGCFLS